ncbi:MAG: class IV adenylate cyclase [Asgard group archaeon]|nr:class IV adenylate cyclase [Asgard group archaeon]
MVIEVEMKIKIDDLQKLEYRLIELGAKLKEIVNQRDQYFAHPKKDFAKTDETLRIREEGNKTFLTYKGPKFDPKSKTRVEINAEFIDVKILTEILDHLDFKRVLVVLKERKIYDYKQNEFCLDEVEGLGSFLEVERIIQEKEDYQKVRNKMEILLRELQFDPAKNIRESYLELILARK